MAQTDLVLASPQSAVDFARHQLGADAVLHQPGLADHDAFTAQDRTAFEAAYPDLGPFILILGRKSGVKNYAAVMRAYQQVVRDGSVKAERPPKLVMIGPDEDGVEIDAPFVKYLGRQPRAIVRGALMSCEFLINMSRSESFGMVVVEAWRAGKAVIANRWCQAFVDLIADGEDGLLAGEEDLAAAITRLLNEPELRRRLGAAGRRKVDQFINADTPAQLEAMLLSLIQKKHGVDASSQRDASSHVA